MIKITLKILHNTLLLVLVSSVMSTVHADDASTEADKIMAAKRYMSVAPVSSMVSEMANKLSERLPQKKRAQFVAQVMQEVDQQKLEQVMLDAMVTTFSVQELNAFADFYGSDVGKSAMAKFGDYMAILMPAMQQEFVRATSKAP